MVYLNVSLRDPDRVLGETLAVIDDVNEDRVGDLITVRATNPPREVHDLIQILMTKNGKPFELDLIAHAANGELRLGTWSITDRDPHASTIASAVGRGTLTGVRLLGCYTAYTVAGQAAMRWLKDALGGIPVRGVSNMLYAGAFNNQGFRRPGLLVEVAQLPRPRPISKATVQAGFETLPRLAAFTDLQVLRTSLQPITPEDVQRLRPRWPLAILDPAQHRPSLDEIFSAAMPDPRVAPGLLAQPDGELLCPISPTQFHCVTSLFGGTLIRVYPQGQPQGVLLPYNGPSLV